MLEETSDSTPRQPLSPDRRTTPASVDLVALCHSLPPDGELSNQDLKVLKDWTARYHDVPLPSGEYVAGVVDKALARKFITRDEQKSISVALEPALPVQLRKETQEQRLRAEIEAAERDASAFAVISIDFLVAGVHVDGRSDTIRSRLFVGDVVHLVRAPYRASGAGTLQVMLTNGACIGVVPEEEARIIRQELDVGGRVECVVRKILDDGQFPIPVIGSRVHCVASDEVEPPAAAAIVAPVRSLRSVSKIFVPAAPARSPWVAKVIVPVAPARSPWPVSKIMVTVAVTVAGAALLILGLLMR